MKEFDLNIEKILENWETFHAVREIIANAIDEQNIDKKFIGTEFILTGLKDKDIELAKNLFLKFTGEKILEQTKNGEIVKKIGKTSNIYINGIKVAEEENFLFSYNITSITKTIKKALNREILIRV